MRRFALVVGYAAILVVVFMTQPAYADTLTVCKDGCDHATIQAAIDSANSNDIIEVLVDGEHTEADIAIAENLVIKGISGERTTV
jgi:hypothetical protein